MHHLLHLTLFATDPTSADCVTEAADVADRLAALAEADPDAVRTLTGFDRASACMARIATPTLVFPRGHAEFISGHALPRPDGGFLDLSTELRATTTDTGTLTLTVGMPGA